MKSKLIIWIGLLCAVAVVIGVWFSQPTIRYTPHGIFLPAKDYKPYQGPATGTVFILERYPAIYVKLGLINVEQHFSGNNAQLIQRQTLDYAKALAAKHGATAIVITQAYIDQPKGVEKGLGGIHFSGVAINVPRADF